jgi:DNA-binding FadR family transcriptional regulator
MAELAPIAPVGGALTPVERSSVVSAVAQRLLDHLTGGNFAPGTRLPPERQLAEALGVGRSTLREAMAALGVLGLVDVRPGSGSYLTADSSELLSRAIEWSLTLRQPRTRDLIELREFLEVMTAQLAAARADDDDIALLERHVEAMRHAGEDVDAFVTADLAFHFEAARIAGNGVLQDILSSIRSLLHVWFDRTLRVPGTIAATLAEHEAVFEAIRARSPEAAQRRMQELMDAADVRLTATVGRADDSVEPDPAHSV